MNELVEVYVFTQSREAIINEHAFNLLLGGGVFCLALYLAWKVKRKIDYGAERFASVFLFFCALLWGGTSGWLLYAQTKNYSELQYIYDTGSYSVAQGIVHVVHEQPAGGHARGDVIIVDGVEFEFSYFSESFGYHKTISHGGVLSEGANVRLWYCERPAINGTGGTDNLILRVQLVNTAR